MPAIYLSPNRKASIVFRTPREWKTHSNQKLLVVGQEDTSFGEATADGSDRPAHNNSKLRHFFLNGLVTLVKVNPVQRLQSVYLDSHDKDTRISLSESILHWSKLLRTISLEVCD